MYLPSHSQPNNTTQLNHPLQHTINSAHINSLSQHLAVTAKSVVTLAFSVVKQGPQILHWESTKLKNCVLQSTKLRIAACNQPNSKLRLAVTSTLFTYDYTLLHYYITAHKKTPTGQYGLAYLNPYPSTRVMWNTNMRIYAHIYRRHICPSYADPYWAPC